MEFRGSAILEFRTFGILGFPNSGIKELWNIAIIGMWQSYIAPFLFSHEIRLLELWRTRPKIRKKRATSQKSRCRHFRTFPFCPQAIASPLKFGTILIRFNILLP